MLKATKSKDHRTKTLLFVTLGDKVGVFAFYSKGETDQE